MSPSQKPVFRLSLAMSGAVSAGAYTAGVLDFLIRALTEWEVGKSDDAHNVRLVAFAGASAGGITAALGTVALAYGLTYETAPDGRRMLAPRQMPRSAGGTIECVLPKLYTTWVVRPRMVADASGGPDLLSLEDLHEAGEVRSLLNWKALDRIRDEALQPPEHPGNGGPCPFLADPFHVYLTVSNLRGIPYEVGRDDDVYHMLDHGDRIHYRIEGIGSDASVASDWAGQDPYRQLSVAELISSGGRAPGWQHLGTAALATAAFPLGLSARVLRSTLADFHNRLWPAYMASADVINPSFPDKFPAESDFGFVNVDGGMINNDPFEFARYTVLANWRDPNGRNERDLAKADRAVVMISPFPEGPRFDPNDPLDSGLVAVIKRMLPTLIQQARFKPSELAAAAEPGIASRWIIAPRRSAHGPEPASSAAIACGLLGGFGGFLDQSFREHDYQLGQRNCQKFLMDGLCMDAVNPAVSGAPAAVQGALEKRPVIPLMGSAQAPVPLPDWPRMAAESFATVMSRIGERADAVLKLILSREKGSRVIQWGLWLLWKIKRGDLLDAIRWTILADLIRRDQIEDGLASLGPEDSRRLRKFSIEERTVVAALADPQFELRTVSGICSSTKLPREQVQATLDNAVALPDGAVHQAWRCDIVSSGGAPTYSLASRRLTGIRTWQLVGPAVRYVQGLRVG